MNSKSSIDLSKVLNTSDAFTHFIVIAKEMVSRLTEKSSNFFEWEEDVMKVLKAFLEQWVINESEYYQYLEQPFEVSVYTLLKKLYFNGFFSGNIDVVEDIQETLVSLWKLLKSQEIQEIQVYFQVRFEALMEKERTYLLPHLVKNILDSLLHATLVEDQKNVWEMLAIANNYDSTGFIRSLFWKTNYLGIVTHECLYFLYVNGFLSKDEALQERTYITLIDFYALRKPATPEKVGDIKEYRKNYTSRYTITPDLESDHEVYLTYLRRYILRSAESLYSRIYLWEYMEQTQIFFENFIKYLLGEWCINEDEYSLYASSSWDISAPINFLQLLSEKGYFWKEKNLEKKVKALFEIHTHLYDTEIWKVQDKLKEDTDIDDNITWYTWELIEIIKRSSCDIESNYIEQFYTYCTEQDLIDEENYEENMSMEQLVHAILMELLVKNYYEEVHLKSCVIQILSLYYSEHDPKKEIMLMDFVSFNDEE